MWSRWRERALAASPEGVKAHEHAKKNQQLYSSAGREIMGLHTRVPRVPQLENHPSLLQRLQNAPLAERAAWIVAVLRGPARDIRTISAPGHRRDVRLQPRRLAGRRQRRWKR